MISRHWLAMSLGVLLLLFALWQIATASSGLQVTTLRSASPPLTLVAPERQELASRPLVLIGHGYAGSAVIMRGFAFTLAHAGYSAVLWDFDGHGTNPQPLPSDTRDSLMSNAEAALAEATRQGWGDPLRVAIIGHSMGSGVALAFGQTHPDTAATIAVSPVSRTVTPSLPRNLLLMAGSLEASFVENAEQRLAEAGGGGGDPAAGTARELLIIPGVEHISILFSPQAHAAARDWLDATFGIQPGAHAYGDRRVRWYGLALLGVFMAVRALAPLVTDRSPSALVKRSLWQRLGALLGGALAATLLLWLASMVGLELRNLLDLLVGGYIVIWFGLAGLLTLLFLWQRPSRPTGRALLGGLLALGALWLGVGLLGQLVWLPWLLIPRRLLLWPPAALLLLPWFLAVGEVARDARWAGRFACWLAHSILVAGSFFLALRVSPELGFIVIILPLFPIILGLHGLALARQRGSWPFALSGALFTSWLLLAVFPVQ